MIINVFLFYLKNKKYPQILNIIINNLFNAYKNIIKQQHNFNIYIIFLYFILVSLKIKI